MFEFDKFANGTKALMAAVVALTENGGITIIGKMNIVSIYQYNWKNSYSSYGTVRDGTYSR